MLDFTTNYLELEVKSDGVDEKQATLTVDLKILRRFSNLQ